VARSPLSQLSELSRCCCVERHIFSEQNGVDTARSSSVLSSVYTLNASAAAFMYGVFRSPPWHDSQQQQVRVSSSPRPLQTAPCQGTRLGQMCVIGTQWCCAKLAQRLSLLLPTAGHASSLLELRSHSTLVIHCILTHNNSMKATMPQLEQLSTLRIECHNRISAGSYSSSLSRFMLCTCTNARCVTPDPNCSTPSGLFQQVQEFQMQTSPDWT
jgi:hypothetical protein